MTLYKLENSNISFSIKIIRSVQITSVFIVSIQLMCGNCHNILTILLTLKKKRAKYDDNFGQEETNEE